MCTTNPDRATSAACRITRVSVCLLLCADPGSGEAFEVCCHTLTCRSHQLCRSAKLLVPIHFLSLLLDASLNISTSHFTSIPSAFEVITVMHYTNYLLTYLLWVAQLGTEWVNPWCRCSREMCAGHGCKSNYLLCMIGFPLYRLCIAALSLPWVMTLWYSYQR